MKQTIPFKKDITFKTKIKELTAISLDNDLTLKGEDLIVGNFYISGNYKTYDGIEEQEYSYKIPCEIAISDEYDTYDAIIDIDDFYYQIIEEEILRVNITVIIDNLEKKEDFLRKTIKNDESLKDNNSFSEEINLSFNEQKQDFNENYKNLSSNNLEQEIIKQTDSYLTYKVYIFKEEDTIESVLEKYHISKEELGDYNDIENVKTGTKLVIPSLHD